ncbi:hypothetical protein DL96DRAFT_898131 [Flagelloscypha sp. PMI_526]|nr:hypothetical protein DL96DRAFT_898131 [Flagelloscypha sp. PMI_526]
MALQSQYYSSSVLFPLVVDDEVERGTIATSTYIASDTSTITYDYEQGVGRTLYGLLRSAGGRLEVLVDRMRRPQLPADPRLKRGWQPQAHSPLDALTHTAEYLNTQLDPTASTPLPFQIREGEPNPRLTTADGLRILFNVRATCDYDPLHPESLPYKEGDMISLTNISKNGWCRGELVDESRRIQGRYAFHRNHVDFPRGLTNLQTTHGDDPEPWKPQWMGHWMRANRFTSDGYLIIFYAIARRDFSAARPEEMNLAEGSIVGVTEVLRDSSFWAGELVDDAKRGERILQFPGEIVEICPPPQLPDDLEYEMHPLPSSFVVEDPPQLSLEEYLKLTSARLQEYLPRSSAGFETPPLQSDSGDEEWDDDVEDARDFSTVCFGMSTGESRSKGGLDFLFCPQEADNQDALIV